MAAWKPGNKILLYFMCFVQMCYLVSGLDGPDQVVFEAGNGQSTQFGEAKPRRFLLYDVNPGEGFNLRRDVYMRVANLVKLLNADSPWTLVLPPWSQLYHWRSDIEQQQIPWALFFDLESLRRHVPVMEFDDYLKVRGEPVIEDIYYLQRYAEGWRDGKWEERMDVRDCVDGNSFEKDEDGLWRWWFWDYSEVFGRQFQCLSVQAQASSMVPFLQSNTTARHPFCKYVYQNISMEKWNMKDATNIDLFGAERAVMIYRAEHLLHDVFGQKAYWEARRSMVFAKHLRDIGDEYRKTELHSTDKQDRTERINDWTNMRKNHGDAFGGPYVAVHLRRQDFLYGHSDDVPSLQGAARRIEKALEDTKLKTVFVATDAPRDEYEELKGYLAAYKVTRYVPSAEVLEKYKDGGVAIIDQWICAHARYFIGTSVSTFSFRIHEEREILGFKSDATFNRFCGDEEKKCEQPSRWTVKYD